MDLARIAAVAAMTILAGGLGCGGAGSLPGSSPAFMPGTIALASDAAAVVQTAGSIAITVDRTGGTSGPVSVNYATADGTALAGTNYTATTGSLVWSDGDAAAKMFLVPIAASPAFYGSTTFTVTISGAGNGASVGLLSETITITGSAGPPSAGTLGLASASLSVDQSAGTAMLQVNRSGGSAGAVSVSYATADGTALAGTDYTAETGTLSWSDGDTSAKSINVPLNATTGFAGNKTFALMLSNATGSATLGASTEAVTITGSLLSPANYFDLDGVKLQLPIDQYGGMGGAGNVQFAEQEITSAQLAAGFVDPYFYADASHRMVFMAPSNGAVSTPGSGSDHTRSELRELYAGAGADSNGDWNSAIGGMLTASCVVQAVSVDSDEATIGQIHNQSYVFVLMLYRPANKDLAIDIYSSLGSSTHTRTSLVQGVNLGDAVSYSMTYKEDSLIVTATAPSGSVTRTFPIDASWAGTPVYFKLGAYHAAPNIGNPVGDHTQVAFSSFAITH